MRTSLLIALVAGLFAVGCTATAYTPAYSAGYSADYYGPDLAYVSPGVQVVAGYDQPVFYSDNYYWRYHGDRWYRSSYYDRGWVYATPPRAVLTIDRPYRYRNYRSNHYSGRHDRRRPQFRDHRNNQRPAYRAPARTHVRQAPVRTHVRQAPARTHVRQAPVRRDFRSAPARREPARSRDDNRRRVRNHR